jgi:hypothetical protein
MGAMSHPDHSDDEAVQAIRDAEALKTMRTDHAAFFAVLAASPDAHVAVGAIAARFGVSRRSAEFALQQRILGMLPRQR